MSKEKITVTLDSESLRQLRETVGARSISESIDAAVRAHLARLRHRKAVDAWLAEMDREHGPVPTQTLEWAARIIGGWQSRGTKRRRRAG
jgi:Arc/MetJ-type ribon-helix-helix transcriptional regulator